MSTNIRYKLIYLYICIYIYNKYFKKKFKKRLWKNDLYTMLKKTHTYPTQTTTFKNNKAFMGCFREQTFDSTEY